MAVVFKQGDTPTKWDLKILIKDDKNRPFDPYSVTYSFYADDKNRGKYRIGMEGRVPFKEETGYYYVGEKFSTGFIIGDQYVEWAIMRSANSPIEVFRQQFGIIK
jgi:hypothetical protein